jgi:hypothetical protein
MFRYSARRGSSNRSMRITGMYTPRGASQGISWSRAALLLGLAVWTLSLLRTPLPAINGAFLHLINLIFHEAGHIVFAPFGTFMMTLGGSLLQVIVPFVCAWAFVFQQQDPFAASVCVWWAGESLLDLSPYIDDARSLQLMLLGGPAAEVEGHDWEAILMSLGWLHLDHTIARAAWLCGATLMLGALAYSFSAIRSSFANPAAD